MALGGIEPPSQSGYWMPSANFLIGRLPMWVSVTRSETDSSQTAEPCVCLPGQSRGSTALQKKVLVLG